MIEMLTKLEEAPRDRHGFKRLTKFIRALTDRTGVDFYPCMYGGGKDGKMCAVVGAKSESGADLCLAAFPGARTLLCVRGGSATRQLEAESPAADAPGVAALLESVAGSHLEEIAGRIGDELTVAACGLEWQLVPIAPPKEEEDDGMPQAGGKSGIDPALEARIRKALAEQLAKEGRGERPQDSSKAAVPGNSDWSGPRSISSSPSPAPAAPVLFKGGRTKSF
jgi:hypothetical protein